MMKTWPISLSKMRLNGYQRLYGMAGKNSNRVQFSRKISQGIFCFQIILRLTQKMISKSWSTVCIMQFVMDCLMLQNYGSQWVLTMHRYQNNFFQLIIVSGQSLIITQTDLQNITTLDVNVGLKQAGCLISADGSNDY